jgi:hypothetical protein
MLLGRFAIPPSLADWLMALADLHERFPEPVGWREKIPYEDWLAERQKRVAQETI